MYDQLNETSFLSHHVNSSNFLNISTGEMAGMASSPGNPIKLSPALLLSFTVCLALLVTIGLLGNVLVIFTLIRTKAYRATTTNAYILNLSIADLLFLIFCVPFQGTVYILNDWPFRQFMCKAAHFFQYCTMYASIWILTVMSVDRYVAIGHPLKSVDMRSPGQAMRVCIFVWFVSGGLSIPWGVLYRTVEMGKVTACFDYWPDEMYEYRKWLFLLVFLTGFVLPSFIIFFMSVLAARSIRCAVTEPLFGQRRQSSVINCRTISRRRRRVVWLVFGLALTFFLCWLPQNASFMWLNFYPNIETSFVANYQIYFIVKVTSHMLTYLNSSINPILYSLASGRFRSRLAQAFFKSDNGPSMRPIKTRIPSPKNAQNPPNPPNDNSLRETIGKVDPNCPLEESSGRQSRNHASSNLAVNQVGGNGWPKTELVRATESNFGDLDGSSEENSIQLVERPKRNRAWSTITTVIRPDIAGDSSLDESIYGDPHRNENKSVKKMSLSHLLWKRHL